MGGASVFAIHIPYLFLFGMVNLNAKKVVTGYPKFNIPLMIER